ncbi:hypothetical protein FHR81_003816 [Actinoalloteichus hoggarensis]|uniref:hypothetical protein n=1 Tax=Actinoalloteichus hoggarensis TaxID=1470176 RepID=UPI000B8B301C|nr:hypothetical protein [Actinoalloteichus hoggarensis]MBB5922759.1 hypothetical protein [Actinoalloteichus hoggarensis]
MRAALVTGGLLIAGPGMASAEIESPVTDAVSGALECCPDRTAEAIPASSAGFFTGFLVPQTAPPTGIAAEVSGSETSPAAAFPRISSGSPDLPVQQESRNTMTMPAADDAALPDYDQPRFSQHRQIAEYWDVWADVNSSTGTLSAQTLDRLPVGPLFHGLHRVMTGQILTEPAPSAPRGVDTTAETTEFSSRELAGRLHQASVLDSSVTTELPRITELTRNADDSAVGDHVTAAGIGTARSTDQVELPGHAESVLPDGSMLRLSSVPTEVIRASLSRGPLAAAPVAGDVDPLAVWGELLPGAGDLPRIPELIEFVRSASLSPVSVLPEMGRLGGLGVTMPPAVALPAPAPAVEGMDAATPAEFAAAQPADSGASDAAVRIEGDDRPTVELPRVWALAEEPADLPMLPAIQAKSWGLPGPTDLPEIPELADEFGSVSLSDPAMVMVSLPTPTAPTGDTVAEGGAVVVRLPASVAGGADGTEATTRPAAEEGSSETGAFAAGEQSAAGSGTAALADSDDSRQRGLEGLGLGDGLPLGRPGASLEFDALNGMNELPLLGREAPALSTLDTAVLLRDVTGEESGDLAARH